MIHAGLLRAIHDSGSHQRRAHLEERTAASNVLNEPCHPSWDGHGPRAFPSGVWFGETLSHRRLSMARGLNRWHVAATEKRSGNGCSLWKMDRRISSWISDRLITPEVSMWLI